MARSSSRWLRLNGCPCRLRLAGHFRNVVPPLEPLDGRLSLMMHQPEHEKHTANPREQRGRNKASGENECGPKTDVPSGS